MQTSKRIFLLIINFILIQGFALGQSLTQKLQTAFERLQRDSQTRYASISLTVLDARTGELLFGGNPDMGLAPASTLKTVTAITSFFVLGKDFQYQTQIGYTGKLLADGTLNGDIIIKGSGDPTLGSWRWETTKEQALLNSVLQVIRKAGIKKVAGRVIGDASAFGTQSIPEGWIQQDIGNYYGAGTSGLCWRENQFDILLRTGASGTPISVAGTTPKVPYFTYKSELLNAPAGTGDKAYAFLPVSGNTFYLRGTYATDESKKRISVAMPDPAFDLANRLNETLTTNGITVSATPESSFTLSGKNIAVDSIATKLLTITSPRLSKIIYWLNQKSVNLYGEQLLKTLAVKAGKPVTTQNGASFLHNFWKARGVDPASINTVDGSGLSPGNRITTRSMSRILQSAKGQPWYADFYESLPTYNNMKMKSGTINDGLAYAGYQTHAGRELCYAIIVNNYSGSTTAMRQKMFRVLDELK